MFAHAVPIFCRSGHPFLHRHFVRSLRDSATNSAGALFVCCQRTLPRASLRTFRYGSDARAGHFCRNFRSAGAAWEPRPGFWELWQWHDKELYAAPVTCCVGYQRSRLVVLRHNSPLPPGLRNREPGGGVARTPGGRRWPPEVRAYSAMVQ